MSIDIYKTFCSNIKEYTFLAPQGNISIIDTILVHKANFKRKLKYFSRKKKKKKRSPNGMTLKLNGLNVEKEKRVKRGWGLGKWVGSGEVGGLVTWGGSSAGAGGWRSGSVVKSTGCFSRVPRFNSQHPHGSSQLSLTPVPGDPTPSLRHACRSNTNDHVIKK